MLFFDYIYYFFCTLYLFPKQERIAAGWRISGYTFTVFSLALFSLAIVEQAYLYWGINLPNDLIYVILSLSYFLFFGIRYTKFVSYEKIAIQLNRLSSTKQIVLNILLIVYLIVVIAFFIYIIFLKEHPHKNTF